MMVVVVTVRVYHENVVIVINFVVMVVIDLDCLTWIALDNGLMGVNWLVSFTQESLDAGSKLREASWHFPPPQVVRIANVKVIIAKLFCIDCIENIAFLV